MVRAAERPLYWLFRPGTRPGAEFGRRTDRHRRVRLPAHLDGSAEISDPRNSEHKILAQIQNLFELAHNDCMDHALTGISAPSQSQIGTAFDACHQKVIWTCETIVATDFVPRIADQTALSRITGGALSAYTHGTIATSTLPPPGAVHTYLYSCKPGSGTDATIQIPTNSRSPASASGTA
jgi:hypothetical protein